LHDLKLAIDVTRKLELPFGVVINRADIGDDRVIRFCEDDGIPLLAEIPNERRIAEAYSRGELASRVFPEYADVFNDLYQRLLEEGAN
jgi:MinD superfamily P-loop ATPase